MPYSGPFRALVPRLRGCPSSQATERPWGVSPPPSGAHTPHCCRLPPAPPAAPCLVGSPGTIPNKCWREVPGRSPQLPIHHAPSLARGPEGSSDWPEVIRLSPKCRPPSELLASRHPLSLPPPGEVLPGPARLGPGPGDPMLGLRVLRVWGWSPGQPHPRPPQALPPGLP